jgi:hypothetical protein
MISCLSLEFQFWSGLCKGVGDDSVVHPSYWKNSIDKQEQNCNLSVSIFFPLIFLSCFL